jgi:hypothetical protein
MKYPRKPGFVLPVAVTLTVLLGLYVGAYYAMVEPVSAEGELPGPIYSLPFHKFDILFDWKVTPWFEPAHWLDRRIRPRVWEPE